MNGPAIALIFRKRLLSRRIALGLLPAVVGFTIWETVARAFALTGVISAPSAIFAQAAIMIADGTLAKHVGASLFRVLIGYALGGVLGVAVGFMLGEFAVLRRFSEPYIQFLRFTPPISLISIAIIVLGIGEAAKVSLIVFTTFFLVLLNVMAGVLSVPIARLRAIRSFGAGRFATFLYVSAPSSFTHVLVGLRVGMGASFATIVIAEMLAADRGIGFLIFNSYQYLDIARMLLGIFVLGLLGYGSDVVLRNIQRRFARFQPLPR